MSDSYAVTAGECDTEIVLKPLGKMQRRGCGSLVPLLSLAAMVAPGQGKPPQAARIPLGDGALSAPADASSPTPPAIVVGFVGGFVRHDDSVHSEVQLATRLRQEYPSGVDVETFESYRGEAARKKILSLLGADRGAAPTADEKRNARVILYGHSWGGSEAITVARELGKDGVPVLLTIQVDSVSRFFTNDQVIPPNVAEAVNFYQPDGFVHGQPAIRAADPNRTRIIGNFKSDYRGKPYTCSKYPWFDHYLVKPHTQIECDPDIWNRAEALIRSALSPTGASESKQ
jgi:hypothetical protein